MEINKELLNIHLAELKFVHDQMHVRMTVVSRLIALSVTFFTFMLSSIILKFNDIFFSNYEWLLLLVIFPFFVIAMLIAREDFLMLNHDKYFFIHLRPAILKASGVYQDSNILMFLNGMAGCKIGAITSFASLLRYGFPLFGMLTPGIIGFIGFSAKEHYYGLIVTFVAIITFLITLFVLYNIYRESKCVNLDNRIHQIST